MKGYSMNCILIALNLFILVPVSYASSPGDTTYINITGTLVDTPECVVNGNDIVDIDFGNDVLISRINSGNYKKQIAYSAICGAVAQNGLTITIRGKDAGFGSGLLGAGKEGLGIRLYEDTNIVSAGEEIQFDYPNFPNLYAELVKDDKSTMSTGEFLGSATMVIGFQ